MMFTRVAPLRLIFSLMGSRTLVARTISCRTPRKALPTKVSLSPRLYTSAVSMKLMPLSNASFTIRVVSSWPRLPMSILPPNCIVPSATSLTMSPVFPIFLYFIFPPFFAAGRSRQVAAEGLQKGGRQEQPAAEIGAPRPLQDAPQARRPRPLGLNQREGLGQRAGE